MTFFLELEHVDEVVGTERDEEQDLFETEISVV
jgi:hypothetical protein